MAAGKLLYQRKGSSFGRVVDPVYVGMMNAMMQETLLTGTARKAELPGWQAAGKTGTSQDWRDAWFVGYTSRLVAAVWLGNDDGSPTRKASGGNLPVDIWSRFMKAALKGITPVPLPGSWHSPAPSPEETPVAAVSTRDPTGRAAPPVAAGWGWGQPAPQPPVPQVAARPGAPLPIGPLAVQARDAPTGLGAARDPDAPRPPAPVPGDRNAVSRRDKSLLDQLFGG
jgi:penicillin-binding protein 1A